MYHFNWLAKDYIILKILLSHNKVQISVLFKKTKLTLSKSIYFHFKTPAKQKIVFPQTRLGKSLNWQKFSAA